jgi:hypothetical protein
MTTFPTRKLPLHRLADQVGALLALVQHIVHSGKGTCRQAGRGFLVVDLLASHILLISHTLERLKQQCCVSDIIFAI